MLRNDLANFRDRLKALEAKEQAEGIILSYAQISALNMKKDDDAACGEIETAHPGYLSSQDTFYVGNHKGVGRVNQQTFVDTYDKVAFAKLYTTKTPITSADVLNEQVLQFFESHNLPMLRILTGRGTEYCGKAEQHDYEVYLTVNDIEHTKPRPVHLRPTASVSGSTRPSCRGFTRLPSASNSTWSWRACDRIWTRGWITTILNVSIRVKCVADEPRWKRWKTVNKSGWRRR